MGVFENIPYTNFHETNLEWVVNKIKSLEKDWSSLPENLKDYVYEYLDEHPEFFENGFYITPQKYGAVGDGVHDDTLAFQTMAAACTEKSFVVIPKGAYLLTADVFCNVDVKSNEGVFINKHFITQNNKDVMFAQSNMQGVKIVDINSGYTVQAFCYNKNDDVYYLGTASPDDNTQVIITLDNRLNKISETTLTEPALHLNTLTYDSVNNRLLTIRSGGHDILEINLTNGTVSQLVRLDDFNSGMIYDDALNLFVGVNGPAISGTRKWNYRVYDTTWNVIHTGEFENPYGYTTGETPNGYSVHNGLMVHSAFTNSGMQFGTTSRIQFLFSCDLFGHVKRVYQEYVNTRELEGIAFNGKQYITPAVLCDGKALLTMFDPDCIYSDVVNNINQRCELPIAWDNTYVDALVGHFNINARERKIECCGYIRLKTGLATDTEMVLGTIPANFTPWGTNAAIPTVAGTGRSSLCIVNNQIRCNIGAGAGRYLNMGGYWYY